MLRVSAVALYDACIQASVTHRGAARLWLVCLITGTVSTSALRLVTFGDSYTDYSNALRQIKGVLGADTVCCVRQSKPKLIRVEKRYEMNQLLAGLAWSRQLQARHGLVWWNILHS